MGIFWVLSADVRMSLPAFLTAVLMLFETVSLTIIQQADVLHFDNTHDTAQSYHDGHVQHLTDATSVRKT